MSLAAWFSVAVVAAVFYFLADGRHPPYRIMVAGLALLLVTGVIEPRAALAGFGNEGLVTIAVLFVVAAGLKQTGALAHFVQRVLGRPRTVGQAQRRLVAPVTVASAFMNNTPLVAMLMPVVMDWSKSTGIRPSKLLLPLSYAAILGGLCTLIGTSTNLVVNGLFVEAGAEGFGLLDIGWVGVPCALVGGAYLLLVGRFLPDRAASLSHPADPREYTVEMAVSPTGPLVGRSIEGAGLRHLPGLYLMEIHRTGRILAMVDPGERLHPSDQLVFVGVVASVVDLQRIPGLEVATRQVFKLDTHRAERCFVEAVVSHNSPLLGRSIREGRFRSRYDAVVIAVSRGGKRVPGRIGDIELHTGDALLLETTPAFVENQRDARDFYLVSRLDGEGPPTSGQAPIAIAILVAMVVVAATGLLSMLQAGFAAAAAMLLTRCCSEETAFRSADWPLLLAIAAAFGLAEALDATGAARAMANLMLAGAGTDPFMAMVAIYATTMLLTELVTNNAAAVIVFPIAMATATQLDVSPMPFMVSIMVASSCGFATPLGYQTHLMVYGPGGYRLGDFLKMGIPLNVIVGIVTCALAPRVWPF